MGKSHFPIDLGVLVCSKSTDSPKSTILELGSGEGTNLLTQQYNVYSVEDNVTGLVNGRINIYSLSAGRD